VFDDIEEVAEEGVAESFLQLSLDFRNCSIREKIKRDNNDLFNTGLEEIKSTLKELFEILEGSNMEFAYRTMEEILRYMKVSFELAEIKEEWDWKDDMDVQILQKILPKLHGSKRKMEPILTSLKGICNKLDFKNSNIKLDRMIKTLSTDQFVSFI
jgi:5-methylcytosine-specific restriction protein B